MSDRFDGIMGEAQKIADSYKVSVAQGPRFAEAQIVQAKLDFVSGQLRQVLAELEQEQKEDLYFHKEQVTMSLERSEKPTHPDNVYTLRITTGQGAVHLKFSGGQFHTIAELTRLQKLIDRSLGENTIPYSGVIISQSDLGMEATLTT